MITIILCESVKRAYIDGSDPMFSKIPNNRLNYRVGFGG